MGSRVLVVTVAAVLVLTGLGLGAPQAAYASCAPPRPNEDFGGFAGTQETPATAPDGVKADVEEYQPFVTEGSEVSAWVMLNRGGTRWAQIGWWRSKDGGLYSRYVFEQHVTDGGVVVTNFSLGQYQTTNYRVDWTPATNTFSFKRGGTELWAATLAWDPQTFQIYGETHRKSDQMPGGTGAHQKFSNTYMSYVGDTGWWSLTSSAGSNQGGWYGATRVNSVRYEIWDKACAS